MGKNSNDPFSNSSHENPHHTTVIAGCIEKSTREEYLKNENHGLSAGRKNERKTNKNQNMENNVRQPKKLF